MFFQINITPKEKKISDRVPRSQVNNNYSLLLAPFQPPTRIRLDTQINTLTECKLVIKNSNNRSLTVAVTKIPPQERCLTLSQNEWSIQPDSSVVLNISWEPRESGSWRDILQLSDNRRLKYDIPLTLTSIDLHKGGNGKEGGKTKRKIALGVQTCNGSYNKKSVSNSNKQVTFKDKIQPVTKRMKPATIALPDKENISNNIGFNWMLEQAKTKKQNQKQLPSSPPDFSKFFDSSSFKFTPVKSIFSGFESTAGQDTTFTPKNDNIKINESWFSKQASSSVKIKNKVQMTLRKETYVKVPKYLNAQSGPETNNNGATDVFDDSLSPKQNDINIGIPQSEFSILINDIKFTPSKNTKTLSNNNLKFSPNCCSTSNKFDRSESFTDDLVTHSDSKNATFDLSSANSSKINNTYELPISPTSSKTNSHLKPTCLAKSFDQNNLDIGFSTPLQVNSNFNISYDHTRFSNQFSKSQVDFGSAKDCLEADLWVKSKNTSLSPISKNLMHSTLDSITEEDDHIHDEDKQDNLNNLQTGSRTKALCIEISPPKLHKGKSSIRKVSPTKNSKIIKGRSFMEKVNSKKKIQINQSIKSDRSIQKMPGVRINNLSLARLTIDKDKGNHRSPNKHPKEVSVKLHDPNDFLTLFCNPDPFAATMTFDPFLARTLYYDDKWIIDQESQFKKLLNLLLTPPEHLTADVESTAIDVGKVWQSCRTKENLILAETKESVSARYHTNTRLNTLRKAACAMFRKAEVIKALSQTAVCIEKDILLIRSDKDLHRDIGLQKTILELFISYNPLWLRIGLETVYGETIPLHSNNDLVGLSRFLLNRFFSDPFIVRTHSSHTHPNIRLGTFQPLMNRFMLKKFLFVVYFLDYAKRNKLIGHDPCLFHKKASITDSRSILLTFSRELLSGIGDITKVLRNYNFIVSHKQTYLDEFDYAVTNLSTDLRDGVRLCRVMELITVKRCLTCQCRVPPVSRLQKVHNVNIALTALKEAGYTITGDIDAKSIADGHKEKTLSLLWQLIYKFQRPRFEKAAKTLQYWWRSKLWYVRIRNILKNRKHNAASIIQRVWKCYIARKRLCLLRENYACQLQRKICAAQKIQSHWKLRQQTRKQQKLYHKMKISACKIQKWWKRIYSTKSYIKDFKRKLAIIVNVQRHWRAKQLMQFERKRFAELKINVIIIQTLWRSRSLTRQIFLDYQHMKSIIIFIQNKWRANLLMKSQRQLYVQKCKAIQIMQNWWRRCLKVKKDRSYFLALKKSVTTIKRMWIAKRILTIERVNFLMQKRNAVIIQKAWRNYQAVKQNVLFYKQMKNSCLKIQSWWRSVAVLKKYLEQRSKCIQIQRWWRNMILAKKERSTYLVIKNSVVIIQKNWRMKKLRKSYKLKKVSVLQIELWYINIVTSKTLHKEYLNMKNATLKIQSWWRIIQHKQRYNNILNKIAAAIILQQRWKALRSGREARRMYTKYRNCVTLIQQKWRATQLARQVRSQFRQKQSSAIVIQKYWKSYIALKEFNKKKRAAITIQKWRKHIISGRKVHAEFILFKKDVVKIQRLWRSIRQRREFIRFRKAAIIIQKKWRCYRAFKRFQMKKKAARVIQSWRRNLLITRHIRTEYIKLNESIIKIQSYWRMVVQMTKYKRERGSAIVLQKHWRRILAMREYERKKIAVLFIENWRKHILFGRHIRIEFLRLKMTVIRLQQLIRVKVQTKIFKKERDAAMKIQKFWRSIRQMRECKKQYERQKLAVIILQRRYRAKKIAVEIRKHYYHRILAATKIQEWWKCIVRKRKIEILIKTQKWAIVIIENWWVSVREEQRIRLAKVIEFRQKCQAATNIQAAWRGFKVRQAASKKMTIVRERAKEAAKAAVPSATLASRLQENIEIFKYASNIGQLSLCLSSLDVITRLSPNACINVCQLNLVSKLYDILTRANRSLPWLDVCLKDISILLTLAKFKPTTAYVFKEEYIEVLARLLTISVDKKEDLFLHTATLMWVLTENYEYAEAVKNCSRTKYLLSCLYSSINKKLVKASSSSTKCKGDVLPSPKPDWGLRHKRPRTFVSVFQAITSIASRLKILNIAQTPDTHRSFNFSM